MMNFDMSGIASGTITTLIFPAVNQAAFDYIDAALERGETVHCAASFFVNEIDLNKTSFHHLPQIYDDNFLQSLNGLIIEHRIQNIVCPVSTVYDFIERLIRRGGLSLRLIGKSPIQIQIEQHHRLMKRTKHFMPFMYVCADGKRTLNESDLAGVLRYSSLVYGESNDDKLVAMLGVMSSAPEGDVIEIGSLMGRSAFVLIYAAWHYNLGSTLTIDPWSLSECIQIDSPENLKDVSKEWDFEVLKEGFFVNLVPVCNRSHVHLRMPAEQAYPIYADQVGLKNKDGDIVAYAGKISAIHIDGNHDYESVKRDCELWLTHLQVGSWLILDDYIWAHGDGPYRVGNDLLLKEEHRIACSFVCGKALFIQFNL